MRERAHDVRQGGDDRPEAADVAVVTLLATRHRPGVRKVDHADIDARLAAEGCVRVRLQPRPPLQRPRPPGVRRRVVVVVYEEDGGADKEVTACMCRMHAYTLDLYKSSTCRKYMCNGVSRVGFVRDYAWCATMHGHMTMLQG